MSEELLTLDQITAEESVPTPGTLDYWSRQAPRVWSVDIDDATRARDIDSAKLVEFANSAAFTPKEASLGSKIGRGLTEVGSALMDTPGQLQVMGLKYSSPSMTEDESEELLTAVFRNQKAIGAARRQIQESEGTAGSYWTAGANAIGQGVMYAVAGLATGGMAVPIVAGSVQATAQMSQDFAEDYAAKTGDDTLRGQSKADDVLAVAHGVVSGYIESKLGVERMITRPLVKSGVNRAARQAVLGAMGEGAEEYLQEFSGYGFGKIAGHEDRTLTEVNKDALTGAVFGALAGGTLGAGMYYVNRDSLAAMYQKQGLSSTDAKKAASDIIDEVKAPIIREVATRSQLENHFGQSYTDLTGKIESALTAAGWEENNPNKNMKEYAQVVSDDIAGQIFMQADKLGIESKDILDLGELQVIDNVVYLAPQELGNTADIDSKIQAKQNQVQELTRLSKTGAGDSTQKKTLTTQIEILQKIREKTEGERFVKRRAVQEKKARTDQIAIENLAPAVSNTIAEIDVSKMKFNATPAIKQEIGGAPFIYVGDVRLPISYKVVEMDNINASHMAGEVNPNYSLKELQNRASRSTKSDVSILQARAANIQPENMGVSFNTQNGAPIVNEKGDVIAGNGRYEILRMTDEAGRTKYHEYLSSLGYDVSKMQNPILVRELTGLSPEEQIAVADASNVSATSAFDHASQALQDMKLLSGTADKTDFLNKIPIESRQGLFLANDRVDSVALDRRYNDALMMWMLGGDTRLFDELYLMGELGNKTISSLNQVMPALYTLENQYPQFGLREDVLAALRKLPFISRRADFAGTISQTSIEDGRSNLFNDNALLYNFMFGRSAQITGFFNYYTEVASQNAELSDKIDLFGSPMAAPMSKADVLCQTLSTTYPEAFENDVAIDTNMKAVLLTRAQNPQVVLLNQIDIIPNLFADTTTANMINDKTWYDNGKGRLTTSDTGESVKVNVGNPLVVNELFDAKDIAEAKLQGFDSIVLVQDDEIKELAVINENVKQTGQQFLFQSDIIKTENFKKWFGDSKVVDKDGNPLVVYHGTNAKFDTFDKNVQQKTDAGFYGKGFYFSNSETGFGSTSMPVYLTIKTPFIIDNNTDFSKYKNLGVKINNSNNRLSGDFSNSKLELENSALFAKLLKDDGYDGVIVNNSEVFDIEYIAFEPNQIKSINNTGAFSSATGNIYYQSEVQSVDFEKAKDYFGTTEDLDLAGYILPDGTLLDFSGKNQGSDGSTRTIDHREIIDAYESTDFDVDMETFLSGGAIRIDGSLGSINTETMPTAAQWKVIEEIVDKNSDEIRIEVGNYNKVLEKTDFSKVQSAIRGALNNAQSKLAQFRQGKQANGFYDPELNVIVLGKNSNTGTLPHEMAHFWLQTMFDMWNFGKYSENMEFTNETMTMFSMLGIGLNQKSLTMEQHEAFATMTEAVIFGLAPIPSGMSLPMTAYLNWVPAKYESIRNIGYKDSKGRIINPVLDTRAVNFFNAWYQNGVLPRISAGPDKDLSSNPVVDNNPIPSYAETMVDRQKQIDNAQNEQDQADQDLDKAIKESMNPSDRADISGHVLAIQSEASAMNEIAKQTDKRPSWWAIGKQKKTEIQEIAEKFVKRDPAKALEIAFDDPLAPSIEFNGDREALILALMESKNIQKGSDEYEKLHHNIAMTRKSAGKQLGMHNEDSYAMYLDGLARISEVMERNAAIKYAGSDEMAIQKLNDDILAFARQHAHIAEITDIKRKEAELRGLLGAASLKFTGIDTLLTQIDISSLAKITSKEKFIAVAEKLIKEEIAGSAPNVEKIKQLREKSEAAQVASRDINDEDPKRAAAAALVIKDWNSFVDTNAKPTWGDKIFGQWAAQAMLSSFGTHTVNYVSNTAEKAIVKSAIKAQYGESVISEDMIQKENERLTAIYLASGMSLPGMANTSSASFIHGEKYKTRDNPVNAVKMGKDGSIEEIKSQTLLGTVKNINPLQSLAFSDFLFRRDSFLSAAAAMATQDATKDGVIDHELAKKNFQDYLKIQQQPGKGQKNKAYERRLEALEVANIAVFQQNGVLAGMVNKIRSAINYSGAKVGLGTTETGLGTLIAPFVKTPSNLVELGIRATWSPFSVGAKFVQGKYNPITGTGLTIQQRIDFRHFQTMALTVAALEGLCAALGASLDYEPPWVPGQSYDPGKGYDSIIIGADRNGVGGVAISMGAFGPLSTALRTYMSIRSRGGKGALPGVINDIPLLGDMDAAGLMQAVTNGDKGVRYVADWGYTQTNKLVPALARNIIRIGNKEAGTGDLRLDELDVGLPKTGIGRKIGRQYGIDGNQDTANDYIGLFYNRLKITQ